MIRLTRQEQSLKIKQLVGEKNDFTQPTVGHHERLRSCLIADYVL